MDTQRRVSHRPGFLRVSKRLAQWCRVLFCDGRGMGASGGNPFDRFIGDITDADFTAWIDAVGFQEAALIGYSGGGPAAIRYSVRHPERVKALVLIDSFAHYIREPDYLSDLPPNRFGDTLPGSQRHGEAALHLDSLPAGRVMRSLWNVLPDLNDSAAALNRLPS
ncbi:MAG: alpha/beta fold hydrolase [Acidimicrobiales bacterium]